MKRMDAEKKQEVVIYGILWGIVFLLVPGVMLLQGRSGDQGFQLKEVFRIWLGILPFFLLFLAHDLLAAPLWLEKGRVGAYAAVTAALLFVFGGYVWAGRRGPGPIPAGGPEFMERMDQERPPMEHGDEGMMPPPPDRERHPRGSVPLTLEVMKFMMGLLLLGVNLGVKYYVKSLRSERMMAQMKAENLEHQLETLRYQINPHFFMNTLNNIHALVDIDPEQAKTSIEEFSKLMRFILYEGDRPTIPLSKELEFLRHYVSLMKMRYADSVRIDLSLPEEDSGAEVPPLVLASFVENAFKHGISYEKPSFVRVSVSLEDGKIAFKCVNSRQGEEQVRSHGVGLSNVRGRLDLLYGDRYTLHIDQNAEVYDILLLLPTEAARA
ncbi:MAG: histidine kinase [Bacteroidales bacterium]|nr:histidine kinase [Bacteroidales bacterium]